MGIQNTNYKIINHHKNDTCHVQSLEKYFYFGAPKSFYHVFTLETKVPLTLSNCATITLCMLKLTFDTFPMMVNFVNEVGCHNMPQSDYLKHQTQLGQPYQNHETFTNKISIDKQGHS
jgi:hypothetical protein